MQHQCRWRPANTIAPDSTRKKTVPAPSRVNPADRPQQKRVLIIGSLPSRQRKQKSSLSGALATNNLVKLNGMPVDVFHPEPFNAYPIPTMGVVHRMVEHYIRVWAPQQGKPFGFDEHPNPYLSLLWPYALQDATIFEGLVALCRASWLMEHGQSTLYDRGFNFHFNNTKSALQKRLDNPSTAYDDTTLLAVLTVTTIDYTLGEHSHAEQYLQSMRQMVTMRGGVRLDTDWNKFIASVTTAFDGLWSFILSTNQQQQNSPTTAAIDKPSETLINAIPVYAQHPFPPDYSAVLSQIPRGFSNLAVTSLLSMQCTRIIARMPCSPADSKPAAASPPRHTDLHNILTDLLKLTSLSTTKMEHVLLYGLVAYCLPLQYGSPLPASCTSTLHSCVDVYMRLNFRENEEKLDGKCLLWIAIVLASCLDICADEHLRNAPVLERVLNRFPQAKSWTNVEKILRNFLWHDRLATQWLTSWENVMRRRVSPPADGAAGVISPQPFTPSTMMNGSISPASQPSMAASSQLPSPSPGVRLPSLKRGMMMGQHPPKKADERPGIKVSSLLVDD